MHFERVTKFRYHGEEIELQNFKSSQQNQKSFNMSLIITREDLGSSHCSSVVTNLPGILENAGWISGLAQWVKYPGHSPEL